MTNHQNELDEALARLSLSSEPPSKENVQEICDLMKLKLGVSMPVPEDDLRNLAMKLIHTTLEGKQQSTENGSQSTHRTWSSSSDHESGSTDVEFSTKETTTTTQPPVRTTWSSDSQSSSQRGLGSSGSNENQEPGKIYNSNGIALLNQQRNHRTAGEETPNRGKPQRDVNANGTGTMSCTPGRSVHKRTPSKTKDRQGKRSMLPFTGGSFGGYYISQNETNVSSPTGQYIQQQQQQQQSAPLLSRIICGKSQRDQDLEYINAAAQSSSIGPSFAAQSSAHGPSTFFAQSSSNGPSTLTMQSSSNGPSLSSSNSTFEFNPSFPSTTSPVSACAPRSTTPVARRPQATLSPRPGLQEKEDQSETSPAFSSDRHDKKPSPRPAYAKHAGDDDGAQQPSAPRAFSGSPNGKEAPNPYVQTVNSHNTTAATPAPPLDEENLNIDEDTPTSMGATTPMDFSPTAAQTPAPLGGFATGQTPFAVTPMQRPIRGATPFIGGNQQQTPAPTPVPNSQQPAVPEPEPQEPPILPNLPVENAPPQQDFINLTGGTRSRRLHRDPKVNRVRQWRSKKAATLPKVGGQAVGVSSSGSDAAPQSTDLSVEAPRVPSPMEGVQNNVEYPSGALPTDATFQLGKPKPKANARSNRFNLPSNFLVSAAQASAAVAPEPEPEPDYSGILQLVASKREEARSAYLQCDYPLSIKCYTGAIQSLGSLSDKPAFDGDVMAILLSNRAAGLVMLGAFDAAVRDCRQAITFVSDGGPNGERFTTDSGPPMKLKIQIRLARSLLRQGLDDEARLDFERAIETAENAVAFLKRVRPGESDMRAMLEHMGREAELGLDDTKKVQTILDNVRSLLSNCDAERHWSYAEPLRHINLALQHADASIDLLGTKLSLLTRMKCWREAAGVLERMAALNVKLDGIFVGDLATMNPFPGVPVANHLTADFFGELRAEDHHTAEKKLSSKATSEAVLRMPYNFTRIYLRALRLQERYPAADTALNALEDLVHNGTPQKSPEELRKEFNWLPKERSQLERTKVSRERGDEYYKKGELTKAAEEYAKCLAIDGEGRSRIGDGANAGGRLHAVLHCNRTACLIALSRFEEALEDASAAIRIHPHYMKAILRRARCYFRLMRLPEAISEFNQWLSLVEEAKKSKFLPPERSPCMFDGPKDATEKDIETVRRELEEAYLAQRRADDAVRQEKNRRENQRQRWNDAFSSAQSAQQRREEWYNNQNDPRRWDSFRNKGPRPDYRRSASAGPNTHHASGQYKNRAHSAERGGRNGPPVGSPGGRNMDHYSVLNIGIHATEEQITKAYRKLAKKYHPDKNPGEDTSAKFHAIKEAHDVLTDRAKRQAYDAEQRRFGRRT